MKQYLDEGEGGSGGEGPVVPYLSMECCQFILKQINDKAVSRDRLSIVMGVSKWGGIGYVPLSFMFIGLIAMND